MTLTRPASNPHAVVDTCTSFRVKHVQELRICDASIIPHLPSFPVAATCFALGNMLGEKLQLPNTPPKSQSAGTLKRIDAVRGA